MKVALIHATPMSIKPIELAFESEAPEVELVHLLDTDLLPMLQEYGEITSQIRRRFFHLIELAEESKAGCIQLTCSAFNNITRELQPMASAKLFRSDEAMLDKALQHEKIGIISTVEETPPALISYLKEKSEHIQVSTLVNAEAFRLLHKGKEDQHDDLVKKMIREVDGKVDAIVLSQYSMAHLANQIKTTSEIISGPGESARRCYSYLQKLERGGKG